MLLELIQNTEKVQFFNLSRNDYAARLQEIKMDELLCNERFRNRLKSKAERKQIYLVILYKFDGDIETNVNRAKIQISVKNKGLLGEKQREKIQKKVDMDIREFSLADFYLGDESDQAKLGAGLGLYYLNYLHAACKEESIFFDARIAVNEKEEETMVNIQLHI